MISKQTIKRLQSLKLKKYRYKEGLFVVEGSKSVAEAIAEAWPLEGLWVSEPHWETFQKHHPNQPAEQVSLGELSQISLLESNKEVLALARIPQQQPVPSDLPLYLALEGIRDPGNLGTILRLADWYGLPHVLCSSDSVDPYHPKLIQATMGSFTRVRLHSLDLLETLQALNVQIIASTLEGDSLHDFQLQGPACLLIGSESHGLSDDLVDAADTRLAIPGFGKTESLNAAMATAIFLDRLRPQLE